MRIQAASPGEARVARWFAVVVLVAGFGLLAVTWARRSAECASVCVARNQPNAQLRLTGGGRFGMHTECVCAAAGAKQERE